MTARASVVVDGPRPHRRRRSRLSWPRMLHWDWPNFRTPYGKRDGRDRISKLWFRRWFSTNHGAAKT